MNDSEDHEDRSAHDRSANPSPTSPDGDGVAPRWDLPHTAGPHQDPTFRSLASHEADRELAEEDEYRPATRGGACVHLGRNIFSLVPVENVAGADEGIREQPADADAENERMLAQLERAGLDAVRGVAEDFVRHHVRRLTKEYAIRSPHESFTAGTLLVSVDRVPTTSLRHATFQWAISDGKVFELRKVRIPVSHVSSYEGVSVALMTNRVSGDEIACLLALVLDLLNVTSPLKVAAMGDIATNTNELLFAHNLDEMLQAAHDGGMDDVILPRKNNMMNGPHAGVDYWPAKDANDAVFLVLSAICGDVIDPRIRSRLVTKEAYSWLSLIFALLAVGGYQLAVAFGGDPPVDFTRYLLGLVVLFVLGSWFCTDRYWKIDR